MKVMKWSSIFLLSVFCLLAFIPQASAKHRSKSRTSFGLSFNLAPAPRYIAVAPAPVVIAPAPVMVAPAYVAVMPYRPYVAGPVYPYPYGGYQYYSAPAYVNYSAPAYIERSASRGYIQPSFSYSYWRY